MVLRDDLTAWRIAISDKAMVQVRANGYSIGEDPGGVTTLNFFIRRDNDTTRTIAEFVLENIIGWWEEGEVYEVS